MMNDIALYSTGMKILTEQLGLVEAERFVFLVGKERFDYTKWRDKLFEGLSGREISTSAMKLRREGEQNQDK